MRIITLLSILGDLVAFIVVQLYGENSTGLCNFYRRNVMRICNLFMDELSKINSYRH